MSASFPVGSMAFESRGPARKYLYLGVRDPISGKVRKVYVGTGKRAAAAAKALAGRKERREAGRRAVREARDEPRAAEALAVELDAAATLLLEAVLLAGGWHRPNYGPWRRKRDGHGRQEPGPAAGRVG